MFIRSVVKGLGEKNKKKQKKKKKKKQVPSGEREGTPRKVGWGGGERVFPTSEEGIPEG
jgi:hypothetical protein